jgi:hypothetical protein
VPAGHLRPGHRIHRQPDPPSPPTGADEVLKLAYEEARAALREQDATLGSVRNRATGLLGAAAVGTSIAAAVGLLNTDPQRGHLLPGWATWSLLALVVVLGAGVMVVLWPAPRWRFGPAPARLLEAAGEDITRVRRSATQAMIAALASNDRALGRRMAVYRLTVGILTLELVVLLLALILTRR